MQNRIEIINPGYSLIPDERLGEPGSKARNPKIAATLHDAGLAETKGTGIRVMREVMDKANLTVPLIVSDRKRDEFTLRLLVHHLFGPDDVKWLGGFKDCKLQPDEAKALLVLREMGYLDNSLYRSINHVDALTASRSLTKFRDLKLLEQHGKGASTYYTAGVRVFSHPAPTRKRSAAPLRGELPEGLRGELNVLRGELPQELLADLDAIGLRSTAADLDDMIHRLCSWRPLSSRELALLLGRKEKGLTQRNIKRLLNDGKIEYQHRDAINHPQQRYVPTADS